MNLEALKRLRRFMEERGFPHFYVARPENFAWLVGGENTLGMGEGVAYLEVGEEVVLHTSAIEHPRMVEEEAPWLPVRVHPWYAFPLPGSPNDLEHDLTPLRLVLSREAQEAFSHLGREAAMAVGEVVRSARPEWTEYALAGAWRRPSGPRASGPSSFWWRGRGGSSGTATPCPRRSLWGGPSWRWCAPGGGAWWRT